MNVLTTFSRHLNIKPAVKMIPHSITRVLVRDRCLFNILICKSIKNIFLTMF